MNSWQTAFVMLALVILLIWLLNKREKEKKQEGLSVCEITDSGREVPMPTCDLSESGEEPLAPAVSNPHWHNAGGTFRPSIPPKRVSKGQLAACQYLERKLGAPMEWNVRPDFLKSPVTGNNLELDCYNATHRIALEFQGAHHKVFPHYFHGNDPNNFIRSIQRDLFKKDVCKAIGIYLIEVDDDLKGNAMNDHIDRHFEYYTYLKQNRRN